MNAQHSSPVLTGAVLLWRWQRLLWWVYGVNLLLGIVAVAPFAMRVGAVLNHSLEANKLVHGFDMTTLGELALQPAHPLSAGMGSAALAGFVFFVFMLFLTGGILEAYRQDAALPTAGFFQACGACFWRFVRVAIALAIVLIPVMIYVTAIRRWSDLLASNAAPEKVGFYVGVIGLLVALFLLMAIRLWFDMAEVRLLVEGDRRVLQALARAFRQTFANFASLFWMYFLISLAAWVAAAVLFLIWLKLVHPTWIGASFVITQAVILFWFAARLWQRASEMAWYQAHRAAPFPVPAAELGPLEPQSEPPAAFPAMPPADAGKREP